MERIKKIGKVFSYYLLGHLTGLIISLIFVDFQYLADIYLKHLLGADLLMLILIVLSYKSTKKADSFVSAFGKFYFVYGIALTIGIVLVSKLL